MERKITISPYDPHWVQMFEDEANQLSALFGEEIVAIHHAGSTAVPGLDAKPIIDILVEVQDINAVDTYNDEMRRFGYEPRGEYFLPGRRYFPKTLDGERTVHVHIWQTGHPEIKRHLAFRDYLISFPFQARAYGRLKQELVSQNGGDKEAYIAGKDDFCRQIESRALAWQESLNSKELSTERIRLIPLSPAQLYLSLRRPQQLEAELGFPISREVTTPTVREVIQIKYKRTTGALLEKLLWNTYWLLVVGEPKFGAGLLGFKGEPDETGSVEIGYGIDPHFRRRGYTTEAAGELIHWALQQEGCQAVTAWSDKDNPASARVLQKIGMLMARETADQFYWIRVRQEELRR